MAITKYTKQAEKLLNPQRESALKDRKKLYDQQKQDTSKIYDTQIFETGRAYEDQYRENAVQKAINERQVAESMANLGLRDSGLNRTQQTAVQLSYGNNQASIDRQRQAGIDGLGLQKSQDLSALKQNLLADKATINQTYDNAITDTATSLYKTAVSKSKSGGGSGGSGEPKGIISSTNGFLSRNYQGLLEDNGVTVTDNDDGTVTYLDRNTNKKSTFKKEENPYVQGNNRINPDVYNGTFASGVGYQPDNITIGDENIKLKYEDNTPVETLGRKQNVFRTESNASGIHFWMWSDMLNEYVEVRKNTKNGKWEEII